MPVTLNPFTGDLAVDQHDRGVLPPTAGGTTDNAIARWDGTSGVRLNDSGVILNDNDLITIPSGASSGIVFGDADTGVYESSDDVLVFKTNATTAMSLSNVQVLSLANALEVTSGGTGVTSLTDGGILLGSGTSGITATARPSNGQLLIGSTGTDPVVASITAGTGITLTPGAGSLTISAPAVGDVVGPGSATDGGFAKFDGTTGKLIKNSAATIAVSDGGTGSTTFGTGYHLFGNGTSALTAVDGTAKGTIIVGDGSGAPSAVAVGTNNYVLTADSAQANGLKWASPSGTWVYLTKTSASASASVTFTNTYLTSTYNKYVILLQNVIPATDAVLLYVRVSTDNGSSWKAGASDYTYAGNTNSVSTTANIGTSTDTEIQLTTGNLGNAAAEYTNSVIWLWDPLNVSTRTGITATSNLHSTTTAASMTHLFGEYTTAGATDGIQFIFSSGNIASGDFIIYGVKDA
jgi:hypothetical protein